MGRYENVPWSIKSYEDGEVTTENASLAVLMDIRTGVATLEKSIRDLEYVIRVSLVHKPSKRSRKGKR